VSRLVLLFLDGVGIGPADPAVNPFLSARLPTLRGLLDERLPTLDAPTPTGSGATTFPLDATLGVEGTPQSGTGQAALLTGESTAQLHGRHFGPWTPVRLRPLVEERSVLRRLVDLGRSVAFANAYPRGWPGARGERHLAGPPLAARGAGLLVRHAEALGRGDAVSSEIVNDGWRRHLGHASLPDVTPAQAGANLARIVGRHDFTLYAHYATDTAGHRGRMSGAVAALERVDGFLGGLLEHLGPEVTLLVVSDHGNIEDVRTGHTRNPALGLATGPGAEAAAGLADIREVTPFVLEMLGR
jgi:2,3-bisphosphoglycerate-independent phosphoglycerate mutase